MPLGLWLCDSRLLVTYILPYLVSRWFQIISEAIQNAPEDTG